jgi:branched-chain amino acid transport system ATP-binding protein
MGEPMVRNHPSGKMKKQYQGKNGEMYTAQLSLDDQDALAAIAAETDEEKKTAMQAEYDARLLQFKADAMARDKFSFTDKVVSMTPDRITKLGIARTFQNIRLWKSMTVFDNVLTAKHMRAKQNVFTATFRIAAAEERRMRDETTALLEEQGLLQYKDDLATSLPYGLQRRLEIARALATQPKLLLLDEPAAGMNPQETQELAEFIVQTRDKYGLTVFLIEHHMDLVMRISDYIYVIDFGSEIAEGVPAEVQHNQRVIDAYLGVVENE